MRCTYRNHKHVPTPTELLEACDEAARFGLEGVWVAVVAGIYYRTMGSLDEIHECVPELRELQTVHGTAVMIARELDTRPGAGEKERKGKKGEGHRVVRYLVTDGAALQRVNGKAHELL